MDIAAFQAAGLYDPDAPTAGDRLALLEFLDERGATLPDIAEADREGVLYVLSAYLAAFGPVERVTLGRRRCCPPSSSTMPLPSSSAWDCSAKRRRWRSRA